MYQMSAISQIPVVTATDGSAYVVIQPYSVFYPTGFLNGQYLSYIVTSSLTTTSGNNPYGVTSTLYAGSLNGQMANTVNFAIDTCSVSFINT